MARTGGGLMACRRLASGVTRRPLRFLVAVCRLVLAGSVAGVIRGRAGPRATTVPVVPAPTKETLDPQNQFPRFGNSLDGGPL